jgi:hypothetical protein
MKCKCGPIELIPGENHHSSDKRMLRKACVLREQTHFEGMPLSTFYSAR